MGPLIERFDNEKALDCSVGVSGFVSRWQRNGSSGRGRMPVRRAGGVCARSSRNDCASATGHRLPDILVPTGYVSASQVVPVI